MWIKFTVFSLSHQLFKLGNTLNTTIVLNGTENRQKLAKWKFMFLRNEYLEKYKKRRTQVNNEMNTIKRVFKKWSYYSFSELKINELNQPNSH